MAVIDTLLAAGPKTKRQRLELTRARLWSDRSTFDDHWRELGDFLQPRRTRWWTGDRNKGDRRNANIIDSTGRYALRTLASGLHAGLTSPARPWMRLTTPDPDLADFGPVKDWLHVVTQRMLTIFAQTNLYNALPVIYGDMGLFGTAAMSVLEDTKDLFRCYAYPIGSYAFGLDARGMVTTFVREYELTVRQMVQRFGVVGGRDIDWSRLSTTVRNLWDQGNYEQGITVVWVVMPNGEARNDRLEAQFLPWASVHYERDYRDTSDQGRLLKESGFRTFPILAPRWDVTGEDSYGTDCPGMTALGDVKQLQVMQRRKAQAIAKQIDPPLVGPPSLRTQKTSLLPGDITYEDTREGMKGLRSIHEVNLNLGDLVADISQTQYRIQRAFYEDLFLMLAQSDVSRRGLQPVTAREVEERHEEKLLALGPVLERTNDELLDPLVDRVYALMEANGLLPEPPQDLHGVTLKVEYISIMAQAQKLVGVVGQDRFLQSTIPLFQAFPEIRHKIRAFKVVDGYGDMLGVDPHLIRPDDEAQQLVDTEAKQQQAAMAAEQVKTLATAAAQAGSKPVAPNSPLDQVLGAGSGATAGM